MLVYVQGAERVCEVAAGGESGAAVVDCKRVPHMPTVTFTIDGKDFPLAPEDYILKAGGRGRRSRN